MQVVTYRRFVMCLLRLNQTQRYPSAHVRSLSFSGWHAKTHALWVLSRSRLLCWSFSTKPTCFGFRNDWWHWCRLWNTLGLMPKGAHDKVWISDKLEMIRLEIHRDWSRGDQLNQHFVAGRCPALYLNSIIHYCPDLSHVGLLGAEAYSIKFNL